MPHSKPFDEGTAPKSLRERTLEMSSMSRDRIADMTPEDVQRVVHELQVHQIELQLQNEELRHSQLELARARDRYADLYEFAPDGYVTLNREGTVLEANLTAAKLLGVVRDSLVGKNLTNFISRQSQDCFYLHRQEVFAAGAKQICELEMQRDGGLWMARLATTVRPDEDGVVRQCRAAISDVSQTVERIKGEIQRRFEASPSIFMRTQQSPGISENLWRQAEFAYLDNPLPALFKEMLFAYLSRYCQVPYCMARHSAFLLRVGRVAGDPNVKGMPASEVLAMLEKPFPSADELKDSLAVLRGVTALTPWPKAGSALEVAVFRLCVPIYMGLRERIDIHGGSIRSDDVQAELRRVLGDVWYDHLIMLISFIQMAHFWSESHPEIVLDSDVELVLGEQQALANWVGAYQDTVSAELKERVSDELVRLEKRHLELKNSYEALQTSFDVQARRLERAEVETAELGRILEQSLNEIYVVDAESLNFIIVNRGARQNLGYSMDELCYLTPVDLKPDYTPESYTRLLERLHLGVEKIIIFQTPHRRKDGSTYDAEVHIQVAHFQQRPCFVSIVRDVTKRNRTEQALRHSEARMKAILASLSAATSPWSTAWVKLSPSTPPGNDSRRSITASSIAAAWGPITWRSAVTPPGLRRKRHLESPPDCKPSWTAGTKNSRWSTSCLCRGARIGS